MPGARQVKGKRGILRIVLGIVLTLVGAPNVVRGISYCLLSVLRPDSGYDLAESLGFTFAGVVVMVWGIWLITRGARIAAARRRPPYPD